MSAQTFKRQHPQLSKLVAQLVHAKHQAAAARETAEVRAVLAEMLRRGRDPRDLLETLMAGGRTDGSAEARPGPWPSDRMAHAGSQSPKQGGVS